MQTEREFLDGMWRKVSVLERECVENVRVRALHRRLVIKDLCKLAVMALTLLAFTFCSQFVGENVYLLTITMLTIGFALEYAEIKEQGGRRYGNSHLKPF